MFKRIILVIGVLMLFILSGDLTVLGMDSITGTKSLSFESSPLPKTEEEKIIADHSEFRLLCSLVDCENSIPSNGFGFPNCKLCMFGSSDNESNNIRKDWLETQKMESKLEKLDL